MKIYLSLLCAMAMFFASCGGAGNLSQSAATPTPCKETAIEKETAILIAKGDAVENYTLSAYNIVAEEQPGGWRIVFKLKDPGVRGGGPDYLIDKKTGKILNATYNK